MLWAFLTAGVLRGKGQLPLELLLQASHLQSQLGPPDQGQSRGVPASLLPQQAWGAGAMLQVWPAIMRPGVARGEAIWLCALGQLEQSQPAGLPWHASVVS